MKKHTISKNSWHYRFMNAMDIVNPYGFQPEDICEYRRDFMKAVIKLLAMVGGAVALLFPIYDVLAEIVSSAWHWKWTFQLYPYSYVYFGILGIVISIVLCLGAVALLFAGIEAIRGEVYTRRKPSTIKLAWRSFKDKFCTRLDYE